MVRPLAGRPLDEMLLGPSSAAWSRAPGEVGQVVYVTTDGGQTAPPPDGTIRNAKVLRMDLLQTWEQLADLTRVKMSPCGSLREEGEGQIHKSLLR